MGKTRVRQTYGPCADLVYSSGADLRLERKCPTPRKATPGVRTLGSLRLGLRLLESEAAAAFLPLPSLLEEIDALEALQDVALRSYLALAPEGCMLAHFLSSFLFKMSK